MNRLHNLQRDFSRFVRSESEAIPSGIRLRGFEANQRLAIYRNNTEAGLTDALRNVYPVLNRLVGDDFFHRLARHYIRANPPQSASLQVYGAEMSLFLALYPGLESLPYLPDIARLEWAWHESHYEADRGRLEPAALAQIGAAHQSRLGFELHPSARLMASEFPISHIWQANRMPFDHSPIRLDEGGCRLLVYRPQWQVRMCPLAAAEFEFLHALALEQTLIEATALAYRIQPEFDLQAALQRWILGGLLTDIVTYRHAASDQYRLTE